MQLQGTQVVFDGVAISPNQVEVQSLIFSNLSSEGSKNLAVTILFDSGNTGSASYQHQVEYQTSFELDGQFKQARSLLLDLSNLAVSSDSQDIVDIELENTGTQSITIDQIILSWSDTPGGETLTEVQLGGGSSEWSGSVTSGTQIDITDVSLAAAATTTLNNLTLSPQVYSGSYTLIFIMADGSSLESQFDLEVTDSDTSSPFSVTPTQTSDWASGYCYEFEIENTTSQTTYTWQIDFDVTNFTIYSTWNGQFTQNGSTYSIRPESYNAILNSGQSASDIGFCANKTGSLFLPTNILTSYPTANATLNVTVNIYSDWASGYCANLQITNVGPDNVNGWQVVLDPQNASITSNWNGDFTLNASTYSITPQSSSAQISANSTNTSVGYCANKTGGAYQPSIQSAEGY